MNPESNIDKLNFKIPVKIDLSNRFRTIPTKPNIAMNIEELREYRKRILELWLECGSIPKACKAYEKETGNSVSHVTARKAAIEFIRDYPEQARNVYQVRGEFLDTEQGSFEWTWHLINLMVRHIKTKHAFIRWALKHGYYKKAFHLFKETYNLSDSDYSVFDDIASRD